MLELTIEIFTHTWGADSEKVIALKGGAFIKKPPPWPADIARGFS